QEQIEQRTATSFPALIGEEFLHRRSVSREDLARCPASLSREDIQELLMRASFEPSESFWSAIDRGARHVSAPYLQQMPERAAKRELAAELEQGLMNLGYELNRLVEVSKRDNSFDGLIYRPRPNDAPPISINHRPFVTALGDDLNPGDPRFGCCDNWTTYCLR